MGLPNAAVGYGAALGLVGLGFVGRLALGPLFGANHAFTAFYPGVILAAYLLGAGPAVLTATLSATLAYWAFAAPSFGLKADGEALATMLFFAATSAVSIYFITGMRTALTALAEARLRAEALAASHTELFRNLNERVTNHLQLVAALLQLQARDERDMTMARALSEASARTLLISKAHRNLSGQLEQTLDFDIFARQLSDAALAAQANASVKVVIEPGGTRLGLDDATSVAIVLLECLQARMQAGEPAMLRVGLHRDAREARLVVTELGSDGEPPEEADRRLYLIEAAVEQLGGRFSSRADPKQITSELVFPIDGGPLPLAAIEPLNRILH